MPRLTAKSGRREDQRRPRLERKREERRPERPNQTKKERAEQYAASWAP